MNNNYTHGIIASVWIILTSLLSFQKFPGVTIFLFIIYLLVAVWFIMVWKRHASLNITVKIIGMLGIMFCFFLLNGSFYGFTIYSLDENASIYLIVSNLLANEFVVVFVAALIVSPLLISIFNRHYIEMSIIVAMPTSYYALPFDFSTISISAITIGVLSTKLLGVISATYLSSVILHRFIRTVPSKQPIESIR